MPAIRLKPHLTLFQGMWYCTRLCNFGFPIQGIGHTPKQAWTECTTWLNGF